MEIKSGNLGFIADETLRNLTRQNLNEVQRAYAAHAPKAGLLLSVSSIEGILSHLIEVRQSDLESQAYWPLNSKSTKLKLEELKLSKMIDICLFAKLIPDRFGTRLHEIRGYRNFIHPSAEIRSGDVISLGKAQSAGALLNELIEHLDSTRFIDGVIWEVISGNPIYYEYENKIVLPVDSSIQTHSFMATKNVVNKNWEMEFDLEFHDQAVFNFVYNYRDNGEHTFLRLDRRAGMNDCGKMVCLYEYQWQKSAPFSTEPILSDINKVKVSCTSGVFKFNLNGNDLSLNGANWDFDPTVGIGIYNELRPVVLRNSKMKII